MFRLLVLGFVGICFGALTSAGVFTVLSAVGLVPRFIGKTHSAKEILLYENMIISGTIMGGLFSMFADVVDVGSWIFGKLQMQVPQMPELFAMKEGILPLQEVGEGMSASVGQTWGEIFWVMELPAQIWVVLVTVFLAMAGLFSGMFVGCLALAIAEMLDSIPIFTRRISFRHGLGLMVLSIAIGKLIGSLFYFWKMYSG